MKIAIPLSEFRENSSIADSFGRAKFFLIIDSSSQDKQLIQNPYSESQGGAGLKTAQLMIDHHVDTLLSPRVGQKAHSVLRLANVKVFLTQSILVDEMIQAWAAGRLPADQ